MKAASFPKLSAVVSVAALAIAGTWAPAGAAADRRPNIVIVVSDDQGWGDTGYNGHPVVRTPHLDALAREGVRLDRFYAAAPVCSPTRGSILTGRHPSRYGINWANEGRLPAEEVTLAKALREAGYRTGHFGKWHLGQLSRTLRQGRRSAVDPARYSPPWDHGFDTCFSTEASVPTFNPYHYTDFSARVESIIQQDPETVGREHRWPENFWMGPGLFLDEVPEGDASRLLMDRALAFMREAGTQPFFACIWFHAPHTPVAAGRESREPYAAFSADEQHWYGTLSAMDAQVGRLREELRRLGLADDTLILFCSDNGPSYTHGLGRAGPFRGLKASLLEGGIRVPAAIAWPRGLVGGRIIDVPLVTSDLFPTLVRLAGASVGRTVPVDGEDILPILTGREKARAAPIFFQSPLKNDHDAWARPDGFQAAVQADRLKLLTLDSGNTWALYDLAADPAEANDLAAQQPETVARLRALHARWVESCRRSARGADYR